jgi:DNA-binding MarR family transcriptional regulator
MDDPEIVALQTALRRVLRGLRRRPRFAPSLREPFRHGRLGPRHAAALAVVAREEPLSVGDLSRHLGLSLTTASLLASELAAATLVERREDESDRRRTILAVAERWRPLVHDWLDERAEPLGRALARLDAGDRDALLRGLSALADELEAGPPHGCRH